MIMIIIEIPSWFLLLSKDISISTPEGSGDLQCYDKERKHEARMCSWSLYSFTFFLLTLRDLFLAKYMSVEIDEVGVTN